MKKKYKKVNSITSISELPPKLKEYFTNDNDESNKEPTWKVFETVKHTKSNKQIVMRWNDEKIEESWCSSVGRALG